MKPLDLKLRRFLNEKVIRFFNHFFAAQCEFHLCSGNDWNDRRSDHR